MQKQYEFIYFNIGRKKKKKERFVSANLKIKIKLALDQTNLLNEWTKSSIKSYTVSFK